MGFNPNFVERNDSLRHFIAQNCAMIATKSYEIFAELRRIACNGSAFPSKNQ